MTKKPKTLKVERDTMKLMRRAYGYDTSYELPTKEYRKYLSKLQLRGEKKDENEKV